MYLAQSSSLNDLPVSKLARPRIEEPDDDDPVSVKELTNERIESSPTPPELDDD